MKDFLGLKFLIFGILFFWGWKILASIFWGSLILSTDFLGYSKQSEDS